MSPKSPRRSSRAARRRRITPDDLLQLVFVGDPRISPDGKSVLFTRKHIGEKNEYVTNLWCVPTGGGDPRQFTAGGKDGQGRWSPDGGRIAFVRAVKGQGPQIYTMPAGGGEAVALTKFPEGSVGAFSWSPDGKQLAVAYREADPEWTEEAKKQREEKGASIPPRVLDDVWYRLDGDGYFNATRFRLYLVDAASGEHRKVFDKDTLGGFTFDWSPDGKRIAITANTHRRAIFEAWQAGIYVLDVKTGRVRQVPRLPRGPKDHVRWSPDGKLLAYAGREGKDDIYSTENLHVYVCDPVKGNPRSLSGETDYCLMSIAVSDTAEAAFSPTLEWSADGKRVLALFGHHGEMHVASVPVDGGKVAFLTKGEVVHGLGNLSADGKLAAMTAGTSVTMPEIAVGQVKAGSIDVSVLTSFNRELFLQLDIAKPESHWVDTPDGWRVHTWVMLPPGHRKTKKLPAVLEIHGGPHAQYGVGFFHEFQVLAAAGYAVFYSNPRGSKGYGRDHCAAIRGDWGGADWIDIQAVTAFMKSQKYVDPRRMGIMGGSYGGYMTNWAIGHTDEFAGAITDRCVSNLVSMSGSSDFPITPDLYWEGNFWDRPETLWDQSPIRYMGNVKTPTLIIHSEGDLRCNIEQSEQVFTLLKIRNIPSRFVRYPATTSHGMSRMGPPDLRLHRLGQILDWWKRYLG